jgi:hypothetical protein
MSLRVVFGLMTILFSLSVSDPAVGADSKATGLVEFTTQGPEGTISEFQPLSENEAHFLAVWDGVVVEESTLQLQEMDVIIQLKEDPLILLKGMNASSMALAAANHQRVRDLVKAEVIRLDSNIRRGKGLSPRSSQEIIKREYQHVFNGLATRIPKEALKQIESFPRVKQVL